MVLGEHRPWSCDPELLGEAPHAVLDVELEHDLERGSKDLDLALEEVHVAENVEGVLEARQQEVDVVLADDAKQVGERSVS